MTPLTQKLKKYRSINKGVVKSIKTSSGSALKLAASIPVLVIGSYSSLSAQCTMNILNNSTIPFNGGTGGGIAFDVNSAGGPGNDFSIFEHNGSLANRLRILNTDFEVLRVAAHTDNSASALRVTGNTTTGNFVDTGNNIMFINYGINGTNGQFSHGTNGHVVFRSKSTGAVGFFQLQYTYTGPNIHRVTIAQGGIGDASGSITPGDCSSLVLPVELLDFSAAEKDKGVNLNWATASETENAGFEIQRSMDGSNFESISFVEGKGTTVITQNYTYQDDKVGQNQLYYYRLKQIDFDGKFEYSKILSVKLKGDQTTLSEAYPNPNNRGTVNIDFNTANESHWNISVLDVAGKLVAAEERSISKGSSRQTFSFNKVESGIYFLKIENGEERFYKKVTVNKD